ncbi:MAG: AIR synthase-related protein, partial [Candidatus Omnitrophica bacterium]|nr:AIR synthase-related protein [Candidatus Omnitrophota bacterium]
AKERLSIKKIRPGDKIILTGDIGRNGLAVLTKREDLDLGLGITSDCAPLSNMLTPVLIRASGIRFMRDPTRGGLATTLNEIAEASGLGISIDEKSIPVSQKVRAAGELLGIDPLYVACEGRAVIVAGAKEEKNILAALRRHPLGRMSRSVGEITSGSKGRVILKTIFGTERLVDMLASDPLPRIC